MSKNGQPLKEALRSVFAVGTIVIALVIGFVIFKFIMEIQLTLKAETLKVNHYQETI